MLWRATPSLSWIELPRGELLGTRRGHGEFAASYAANSGFPPSLNGEIEAEITIPHWRHEGSAGIAARISGPWSLVALHLYSRDREVGTVVPMISSFHSGHLTHLAIGSQQIVLEDDRAHFRFVYRSGWLFGLITSGSGISGVEARSAINCFEGDVGIVKFYNCEAKLLSFTWRALEHSKMGAVCLDQVNKAESSTPEEADFQGLLMYSTILRLFAKSVEAGLHANRAALMSGIEQAIIAIFPSAPDPGSQLLMDLETMNRMVLKDGGSPLITWLSNALALRAPLQESKELARILAEAEASLARHIGQRR